ncbi:MAG: TauD/TfdA family dioxygenase, partial [Blastocatellia bacterium]|nr:TauD/TfdA family dioxygenase [Blastocatellia bacterium]
AFRWLVDRHEPLRTVFATQAGQPVQVIGPVSPITLAVEPAASGSRAELTRFFREPFDLARGPLLRVKVVRLGAEDYLLALVLHHIVTDGWSSGILVRELPQLYRAALAGKENPLPPLGIQYADYAVWQRAWLTAGELERQVEYWRAELADAPPLLDLPTDFPRPGQLSSRGGHVFLTLDEVQTERLKRFSSRHRTTLFMTLLAVYQMLLAKLSGQNTVVVGSPIAGRNRPELEPLIGFFVNNLVLKATFEPEQTVAELVGHVRQTTLDAFAHQEVPFERLVEALQPERSLNRTPLFQAAFAMQNLPGENLKLNTIKARAFRGELEGIEEPAKFDLLLTAFETDSGLRLRFQFHPDLFKEETVRRWLGHYYRLLELALESPEMPFNQIELLDEPERTFWPTLERKVSPAAETPLSPVEELVAGIFTEILSVATLNRHADFFAMGGHSLLATQAVTRLRAAFGVELQLRALFEQPTVAELAKVIEQLQVQQENLEPAPPLRAAERGNEAPLSYEQERMWLLAQMEPHSLAYHIPTVIRLQGALDVTALERACAKLVERHEILRTVFAVHDGRPVQVVQPAGGFNLERVRLSGDFRGLIQEFFQAPFDLTKGPLLRAKVAELGPDDYVLAVVFHHIVADGWSLPIFVREIKELYRAEQTGDAVKLAPLGLQFADFALWQRSWLDAAAWENKLAYWREQLQGAPPLLNLPTDFPRPAVMSSQGSEVHLTLSEEVTENLTRLARDRQVTLYMTLLGAWSVLLAKLAGQTDLVIGTSAANRNHSETEGLIGLFMNNLPLRVSLAGNPTFSEVLARVREIALAAFARQDVPFDKIVEAIQPERTLSHNPLFQVLFNLEWAPTRSEALAGFPEKAKTQPGGDVVSTGTAKLDVLLSLRAKGKHLTGMLQYRTDLFARSRMERMVEQFEEVLRQVTTNPNLPFAEIDIRTAAEREADAQRKKSAQTMSRSAFLAAKPKPVTISPAMLYQIERLNPDSDFPSVVIPTRAGVDLVSLLAEEKHLWESRLLQFGAILFRGFGIADQQEFGKVVQTLGRKLLEYRERSTPRTDLGSGLYTSTEYPADQQIPQHNENAYAHRWPHHLWLFCQQEPATGGETPLADSRLVLASIPEAIVRKFEEKGVCYVRNFGTGIDYSWEKAFQTTSRAEVEAYCREANIAFEWLPGNRLRTRQVRQAVLIHPGTGEKVWFNQAHLFHLSNLPAAVQQTMLEEFSEADLPRQAYYGDGSPIESETLEAIRQAFARHTIAFKWQNGDVALVDNLLASHGRMPYTGPRKILVAMTE